MENKNVYCRNDEILVKVIKNQSNAFKKLHEILKEKNQKIFEFNKQIISLKYKIKCLEIENRRLKND